MRLFDPFSSLSSTKIGIFIKSKPKFILTKNRARFRAYFLSCTNREIVISKTFVISNLFFGSSIVTLLYRSLCNFWNVHFYPSLHPDRSLLVEWPSIIVQCPSTSIHDRPLWLKWPSSFGQDCPLSLSLLWTVHITVPVRIGTAVRDFGPNLILFDPWPEDKWSEILIQSILRT